MELLFGQIYYYFILPSPGGRQKVSILQLQSTLQIVSRYLVKKQILDHPVPTTIMKNVYDDVYLGV